MLYFAPLGVLIGVAALSGVLTTGVRGGHAVHVRVSCVRDESW